MNFKMVFQALQKERKRDPVSWGEFKPMTPEYTMSNVSLCSSIFWICLFWEFLLIASYLDMHATTIALDLQFFPGRLDNECAMLYGSLSLSSCDLCFIIPPI